MARDEDRNKMSREEAGRKGGEATRDEYGPEFYSEIGQQQGKENNPENFANNPDKARRAGHEGGTSRGNDS